MINMETMYRGITNSPKTELVALISETDTEIEIADNSVLLANEGIAVIGNGDVAETIKYTEIEGNILKGCIRGYEGVARSWIAGTRVARNFTAGDWNSAIDNISGLYDRLDEVEVVPFTLQPGLQVVTAAKDARFRLGEIRGKTEINGQGRIGLVGVENPYAIATSRNLLPPFYEWTDASSGHGKIIGPYIVQITGGGEGVGYWYEVFVPALPDTAYALNGAVGEGNKMYAFACDASKNIIDTTRLYGSFVTPAGTANLRVFTNTDGSPNVVTFKNPMLTIGTEAESFQPQRSSMLAFQTELHANPMDGSDPDVLFEGDGEYRKLPKWKKVVLDGDIDWYYDTVSPAKPGMKRVYTRLPVTGVSFSGFATKYDGTQLVNSSAFDSADQFTVWDSSFVYVSISNTDSGWGDNYTPTLDEIKAYFNGWKMWDGIGGTRPYVSGTRYWCRRINGVSGASDADYTDATTTLPTTQAPNWSPYNLLYRLAKETAEPVTVEGCLTLTEGDNAVEVGTGIVLRERANPVLNGPHYNVNNVAYPASLLKNKTERILVFYKNNRVDPWGIFTSLAYGNEGLYTEAPSFDQSAVYSVTYTKLDKSPTQPISGDLAANEKAQISDLTAGVAEALQRVSVVEQKKAEKDAPGWIAPTLLNNWVNDTTSPAGYLKDSAGIVRFRGIIKSGATGAWIVLFNLPESYRPKYSAGYSVLSTDSSGAAVQGNVFVSSDGKVQIFTGSNGGLSLHGITFLAE